MPLDHKIELLREDYMQPTCTDEERKRIRREYREALERIPVTNRGAFTADGKQDGNGFAQLVRQATIDRVSPEYGVIAALDPDQHFIVHVSVGKIFATELEYEFMVDWRELRRESIGLIVDRELGHWHADSRTDE